MNYYYLEDKNKTYYIKITSFPKSTFIHCKVHIRNKFNPDNIIAIEHFAEHRKVLMKVCNDPSCAEKAFIKSVINRLIDGEPVSAEEKSCPPVKDEYAELLNERDAGLMQ